MTKIKITHTTINATSADWPDRSQGSGAK